MGGDADSCAVAAGAAPSRFARLAETAAPMIRTESSDSASSRYATGIQGESGNLVEDDGEKMRKVLLSGVDRNP